MEQVKLTKVEKMRFSKIDYNDMKRADRAGYSALYLYWLENGKPNAFDIPLFVDDNGKGILSVETFKRVFWAFQNKIDHECKATIKSGDDGNNGKYNVVHIDVFTASFDDTRLDTVLYTEPKASELKRESSKKTEEKSKAKKEEAEAKSKEVEVEWNKKAVCEISKYLVNNLKIKSSEIRKIEDDILKILEKIR